MKKISVLFILTCVSFLFSCETAQDYKQRVFLEESDRLYYYEKQFSKAVDKSDLKLMEIWADSAHMAYYCSHRAFKDMYSK